MTVLIFPDHWSNKINWFPVFSFSVLYLREPLSHGKNDKDFNKQRFYVKHFVRIIHTQQTIACSKSKIENEKWTTSSVGVFMIFEQILDFYLVLLPLTLNRRVIEILQNRQSYWTILQMTVYGFLDSNQGFAKQILSL